MPQKEWGKNWVRYPKHRRATKSQWDNGEARERSRQPESESQYNPNEFGTDEAVRELELRCVKDGSLIHETDHKRTYFLKTNQIVGVCCGEETCYVFAEWLERGTIHGRPISTKALQAKGIHL